jgi:hypothetical protein
MAAEKRELREHAHVESHDDMEHKESALKSEVKQLENVVITPDSLQGMTDADLLVLRNKMVRKMDAVIMWVLKYFGSRRKLY